MLKAALLAAGFESPHVSKVLQIWRLPCGDSLLKLCEIARSGPRGYCERKNLTLNRIRDAIRQQTEMYRVGDIVELPMPAVLATANKR